MPMIGTRHACSSQIIDGFVQCLVMTSNETHLLEHIKTYVHFAFAVAVVFGAVIVIEILQI